MLKDNNTNEFEFDLKSKEYKGTYCSVWFKKDVESDWLVVADESNCANSALWGINLLILLGQIKFH